MELPPDQTWAAGEDIMQVGKFIAASSAFASAALIAAAAHAGGDNVMFPESYASGTLYTTVDRADNKQFRELFVSPPAAIEAAKKGEPLPSGTVLTLVQYAALLDVNGNPQIDRNGRFIKGNRVAYTVMEKRTGWGAEYPENVRNGEWEYRAFKADKTPNTAANLTACFTCHKPLGAGPDYTFSFDKLKAATAR
jgi:cytochrome c553